MPGDEPRAPIRLKELSRNSLIVRTFRDQFRQARADTLRDAEAFDKIVHVVERLGSFLCEKIGHLGMYREQIEQLARESPLADVLDGRRGVHTPFPVLYELVRNARNDALHQGAFARHLTQHAIEMSLVLEDALRNHLQPIVSDYMVRDPVCAEMWQPISFIRQQMLANSFSLLPVRKKDGEWYLVSDMDVAEYLGKASRMDQLAKTLKEARIPLAKAGYCQEATSLDAALKKLKESKGRLLLVCNGKKRLVGILTAFDLL